MKKPFGFTEKNSLTKSKKITATICVYLWIIFFCFSANAQTLAPGAPGKDAQWATAGKQAVGTSATLESKVWFTLAQGVMTEVYYPDVTVANVHLLQFVVVDPKTKKVETEQDDATHEIKVLRPDSPTFQQINTAKSGAWKITKTYTTDVERDSVLIDVEFECSNGGILYVYYDPSLGNSGMHDTAWNQENILLSQDKNISSALVNDAGILSKKDLLIKDLATKNWLKIEGTGISNGFFGISDALTEIKKTSYYQNYSKAENGNVVQFAPVNWGNLEVLSKNKPTPEDITKGKFDKYKGKTTFVLGFGKKPEEALDKAKDSLEKGFEKCLAEYEKGWSDYVKTLRKVEPKYQAQFNMSAMQLKMLEDKTVRGANIASLTVPWGGDKNANENTVGGYHLIWSRDLYQVATAFMALGDKAAAERALDFLLKVQQKPDGSFPQNSFLDGKPFWGSLQLDEVAFPLILAYQLGKNDKATWENHVKKAADFIVKNGPQTPQERWEEEGGYSPSTIAAEIAGLVCAAEIAKKNGDEKSANLYLKTADEWQANVEKWTVTTNGKYSKSPYYVRITQNGKPDAGEKIELNNGAGFFDEREIVDAGFLELVRLGIKSPDDKIIQNSLKVIDEIIRVKTPNGDAFYRYNHDGYGEMDDGRRWNWDGKYTGKGRLWALLSGERGQYELALENSKFKIQNSKLNLKSSTLNLELAKKRLDAMLAFANDGLMIPEQIWDSPNIPKNADKQFVPELKFGEGTGSATPLAWSMAQFIRLAVNLQEGKNLDTPDVVYNRYVLGEKSELQNNISSGPDWKLPINGRSYLAFLPYRIAKDCSADFANSQSQTFTQTVEQILEEKEIVFWKCGEGKTVAMIFYNGKAKDVEIVGDFTDWKPANFKLEDYGSPFAKNLNYIPLAFSNTARVEYKLIADGKWINDPWNPNKIDNGVGGENSVFTMPDYKPTAWNKFEIELTSSQLPSIFSSLKEIEINSKVFNEKRRIKVYVPPGYETGVKSDLPVLYLQDGSDYVKRAEALNIAYNLVRANKIKPFILVFIDYKDRMKEYWASDDYAKFVAEEVVPAIDAKYKTVKSRDGRAIMGASLGGITSFHAALKYPEIFSKIGGQSSSFWVDNERVVKDLEKLDGKTNFRFYMDDGTLEGVEDSRKVWKLLKDKGFDVTYTEAEAGHNWTAWRDRLADAFITLWK